MISGGFVTEEKIAGHKGLEKKNKTIISICKTYRKKLSLSCFHFFLRYFPSTESKSCKAVCSHSQMSMKAVMQIKGPFQC